MNSGFNLKEEKEKFNWDNVCALSLLLFLSVGEVAQVHLIHCEYLINDVFLTNDLVLQN